ncbi:junctional adhesion molecule A isoform X2 [Tyto alba]|uniref:junctional adhesion molecule A isoform X2 n=1 Tax=Tyto alba TaxID=56313 RepID=UPI001C683E9E|nr:junctional adhesion molecule A isoform X2 [Tyto alba]
MAGAARRGGPGTGTRPRPRPRPRPLAVLLVLGAAAVSLVGAQVTSEIREVPENKPAEIPCSAYPFGWSNTRIEWKFQKGSSLVLLYYEGELTEPYKSRVRFSPTSIQFGTVTREDTGRYICEVVGDGSQIAKSEVNLIVQVPPSKPAAHVPSSATIGSKAVLRCTETDGSPPPTFRWYRDSMLMPADPKSSPTFRNSSYTLDPSTGELIFEPLSGFDTGDYYCEATNGVGSPQKSDVSRMEASEVNVGGIVAAVVVLLMVLALAAFGVWFAYSRGFFSKKKDAGKKVIYSQPSHRSEGEFKQTSSFLV